jgi:hypothetical protein
MTVSPLWPALWFTSSSNIGCTSDGSESNPCRCSPFSTASKSEVFRFLEMQFARADRNHAGNLDAEELAAFVQQQAKPEMDQR